MKPPPPNDPRLKIGDAHTHLFNGADLPVSGFFQNVLAPAYLSDWPGTVIALIDAAMQVLKEHSRTARDELNDITPPWESTKELTAWQFAVEVATRAEALIQQGGNEATVAAPTTNLASSYRELADMIARENKRERGLSPQALTSLTSNRQAWLAETSHIDRKTLARIAERGSAVLEEGTAYRPYFEGKSPVNPFALVHWAFLMTHSRSAHVREYLTSMDSKATWPALLINLLVDYDLWLGDGPTQGSDHGEQVEFWTRYAKDAAAAIRIATFAGYDPLKHAVMKRLGDSSYFDALQRWALAPEAASRRVAGLKLYPPMGFSVWKNEPLPSQPNERAVKIVRHLWTNEHHWDIAELPGHLDRALDDLFNFATEHDIPLMAHGRNSNEAYLGAGAKAHPRYWLERAKRLPPVAGRYPLRVCIAHFRPQFDAERTVRKILDLNLAGKSNIYFDVAFEDEILDPHEADELLNLIAGICKGREQAAAYFMFGTDWIMLAQIPHHERYVDAFDAAIGRCKFWRDNRENLLSGNLRRFLKLDSTLPT